MKPLKTGVDERRVTTARAMYEKVKAMPERFDIGERVKVKQIGSKKSPIASWIKEGEIIYKNNSFITVRFENYNEAYTYVQLKLNEARII